MEIRVEVNGREEVRKVPADLSLLKFLRDDLGLTGAKYGCGRGECGACTVLFDGRAVCSCLTPVGKVHGRSVITVEGLGSDGALDTVQEAFVRCGAFQCGFCTPGFVMSAKALLSQNPNPTDDEIRRGLVGNICRCTGYTKILQAVRVAAGREVLHE
ncbi:MAG: (2Fe-2S)-binding protein [Nitrospinota bacterium]